MVNSGSIIINAMLQKLTKPKMSNAEKFDYVTDYIKRMAGGKLRNETDTIAIIRTNGPTEVQNSALPYTNRISPGLTEFGPLPWQAKQTVSALCQP